MEIDPAVLEKPKKWHRVPGNLAGDVLFSMNLPAESRVSDLAEALVSKSGCSTAQMAYLRSSFNDFFESFRA